MPTPLDTVVHYDEDAYASGTPIVITRYSSNDEIDDEETLSYRGYLWLESTGPRGGTGYFVAPAMPENDYILHGSCPSQTTLSRIAEILGTGPIVSYWNIGNYNESNEFEINDIDTLCPFEDFDKPTPVKGKGSDLLANRHNGVPELTFTPLKDNYNYKII